MSNQLMIGVNCQVGIPGIATENAGTIYRETWHPGDLYYLAGKDKLIIRPPEDKKPHAWELTITAKPGIDVGLIWSDTDGCWKLFVVSNDDTGVIAPASVNVSITPLPPDISEE